MWSRLFDLTVQSGNMDPDVSDTVSERDRRRLTRNVPAALLTAIPLGLGLLHVYWALGGRSGSVAAIPTLDGRPLFSPSLFTTVLVAALELLGWHSIDSRDLHYPTVYGTPPFRRTVEPKTNASSVGVHRLGSLRLDPSQWPTATSGRTCADQAVAGAGELGSSPVAGNSSFPGRWKVPNKMSKIGRTSAKFLLWCCESIEW
jgi:hypothetical protein